MFHAARQDVEIFLLRFGAVPTPLFDTQIAAMVAGFGDQVSYDSLCRSLAGVSIEKAHRFSDWSARPLSASQIAYAAADVTHLRRVYTALLERLARDGRLDWVAEEMAALADPATYRVDPETAWERLRPRTQNRRALGRAARRRGLARAGSAARQHPAPAAGAGRDAAGAGRHRAHDTRPSWRAPAACRRASPAAAAAPGCWPRSRPPRRCRTSLLPRAAAAIAATVPPPRRRWWRCSRCCSPRRARSTTWRRACSPMARSWTAWPTEDAPEVPALHGWRREVFGEAALALKRGRLALGVDGRRVKLIGAD